MYEAGIAMSGLSCFINGDLARDLANDIMTLMSSTKPYIRRRAVLLLYKVFLNNPEALKPAFPRLKEKLEDPDPGVQSAAVNVVCELARRNPKNYLSLAPIFFRLMTTSTNNWVLIKIIKLFGALTPLEPRLGKKLIEPLTNLIHSTSAMSLLYECINTVVAVLVSISSGLPNHNASIQLCVQKLRILIEDTDQNLKYLGLLAMSKILQTHPKTVQAHNDLILQCLDDKDESIRLRALDLLTGMVTRKNLMDIVHKLMVHMDKSEGSHYRDELLSKIIEICSQSDYQHITNFEWYISILVELTRLEGTKHGNLIALQMLDVAVRVESIRPFACNQMAILLENAHLFIHGSKTTTVAEALYAAAWICGEFCSHLKEPQKTLESMLNTKITLFPGHIQSTETSSDTVNGNERVKAAIREGMNPASLPVSLSDQLYRQSKIEEEDRRLKKKSKIEGGSSKKGKKSSKKSDPAATAADDNDDDDAYPTVQVKRGGELPDGVTESGNEDHDDDDTSRGKNKKIDPHRALNIDLNEKPIQSIPTPPPPPPPPPVISQAKEPSPEKVKTAPEKTKKSKKKKTTEKQDEASTSTSKQKHHDYKQVESPVHQEEENRPTPPPPAPVTQEKPKKKKVKEKKVVSEIATKTDTPAPLLLDIMSDDIHSTNQSEKQQNEQDGYRLAAQSDDLTIECSINPSLSIAQIDVTFLLKNRTPFIIDNVSIHVIDSMSSKLSNTTSANIISFPSTSLFPYSQNYVHIYFSIHAISFSQKLKTTLTYSINKSNALETDNIEFKLNLPCSQYLRRKAIDSTAFANLMTSGTLTCQSNVRIPSSNGDFTSIINTLCQSYRLTAVDKINSAASLYAESVLGHPIALLIKSINSRNDLSIDGKSTETHFLSNLMEEIKTSLLK
ncbi:unnamed protein product [Rotaria socialis]|uniref:AP-3 complex subunit delta domain-containing protein n=1 Tax=Rotaria socialis TaxID=392032 RepID=A0A820NFB2_9BILA|nr:unnamed protein product [Rotaria socialis]